MVRLLVSLTALMLVASGSAGATPLPTPGIDFRDPAFSGADRQASFTATVGGITLTLEAGLSDPTLGGTPTLWWDSRDGIGVRYAYEADEIEGPERLIVRFASPVGLSEIFLSDLFVESASGVTYSEIGHYRIDAGPLVTFDAASLLASPGDKSNGEAVIALSPIVPATTITFSAPGRIGVENHEFSVLGLTDPPIPISAPPTLALALAALAALTFTRRRRSAPGA